MTRRRTVTIVLLACACGGAPEPAAQRKPDAQLPAPSPALSPALSPAPAETAKPALRRESATARKRAAAAPLRDSAFGPKAEMDASGKITPIKKP